MEGKTVEENKFTPGRLQFPEAVRMVLRGCTWFGTLCMFGLCPDGACRPTPCGRHKFLRVSVLFHLGPRTRLPLS